MQLTLTWKSGNPLGATDPESQSMTLKHSSVKYTKEQECSFLVHQQIGSINTSQDLREVF